MNEFLFFSHIFLLLVFLLISVRVGKCGLFAFISSLFIFANLFVTKQIKLFNFSASCADVYAVSGILALNLLQEYFGKVEAKRAVNISFLLLLLFALVSKFHLLYIPSHLDKADPSFRLIFSHTPRIVISSIFVFFVVAKFDVWLYGFFRRIFGRSIIISMILATLITQFVDSVAFGFFGLWGVLENLQQVLFISFLTKSATILLSIFFIYGADKILRKPKPANEL